MLCTTLFALLELSSDCRHLAANDPDLIDPPRAPDQRTEAVLANGRPASAQALDVGNVVTDLELRCAREPAFFPHD